MIEVQSWDVAVIGGGPAGLAAAVSAKTSGADRVVILERDGEAGGILNQCIHNGFGLHYFGEELTGPEYALRFVKQAEEQKVTVKTGAMAISLASDKTVTAVSRAEGLFRLAAGAVVLAMGCRERTRGALNIPGTRPAGIYTAGTAQRYVNIEGYLPGSSIVILGSGDIGLIMARRLTLEGAKVRRICELMSYSSGLKRNIVQCADDYGIPVQYSHTVTAIHGKRRVEGVTVAEVDGSRRPIAGTEEEIACDTLLLSVGLIPENELSRQAGVLLDPKTGGPVVDNAMQTSVPGLFACGNAVHVHDLVDDVTEGALVAGKSAANYAMGMRTSQECRIPVTPGKGIRYTVPQLLNRNGEDFTLYFRSDDAYRNVAIAVYAEDRRILRRKAAVVTPGEMQRLAISGASVGDASGLRIELEY